MEERNFNYVYTAPTEAERKEIESIRRQYEEKIPEGESKIDRLRKLDGKVKNTATVLALVLGIVGCLVFGLGMAMVLEWELVFGGVLCAVCGGILMALAMPIYKWTLRKNKKKYGEEILRLSEELLHE